MTRLLLTILLLAACARDPLPGPLPPEALPLHAWPAHGEPRAVILALHGFGDAGDLTFEGAARAWSARGIAVYAPDQRGFGANASRHDWPGVDALAGDAAALSRWLRARHPGLPLVVVGHSMGGGIALAAAAQGLDADALVLAGPAIAGGEALNALYRTAARIAAAAAPERRWTGRGVIDIRPTDNAEAIARVRADPRHFGDPTSRELYGLVELMDRAAAAAPGSHHPDPHPHGRPRRGAPPRPGPPDRRPHPRPRRLHPLPRRLALALPRPPGAARLAGRRRLRPLRRRP